MTERDWPVLATYASGFEADIAMGQLEASDIPAVRDTNDTVGLFGPGFQGASARGITIRVHVADLEEARAILGLDDSSVSGPEA